MIFRPDLGESKEKSLSFHTHKFTNKPRLNNTVFICCFSEFGCEMLVPLYCIPIIKQAHPNAYFIVVGWYGRDYLYRHLVDEFWELKEEFQYLREYSDAFNHNSRNLEKFESNLSSHGNCKVYVTQYMGVFAVCNRCICGNYWQGNLGSKCSTCNRTGTLIPSLFNDPIAWREKAVKLSVPKIDVSSYLGKNPVGIFGRGRKKWGRNLSPDFYIELIEKLKNKGFTPIWLGEKQSTQPCPVNDIVDFSRMPESRDLGKTIAIVSNLKFTIQFWTASTRLSGICGTPFLLFESPVSIVNKLGQEGLRIVLTTFGPKKIVYADYCNFMEDQGKAFQLVDKSIDDMTVGDYRDIIGMVATPDKTVLEIQNRYSEFGWEL